MAYVVNELKKSEREQIILELENEIQRLSQMSSQLVDGLIYPLNSNFEQGLSQTIAKSVEQVSVARQYLADNINVLQTALHLARKLDVMEWVEDSEEDY